MSNMAMPLVVVVWNKDCKKSLGLEFWGLHFTKSLCNNLGLGEISCLCGKKEMVHQISGKKTKTFEYTIVKAC